MIIKPKVRGFVCTTAHPVGCGRHVAEQIEYVKRQGTIEGGPKKTLVVGASTGYGLASRITAAFACRSATLGIFFERPGSDRRTATAGWYNTIAFEKAARGEDLFAKSINGDAFSDEIKAEAIVLIKNEIGPIDLLIYSLASPRRTHPKTGEVAKSTLKPIGQSYSGRTLDTDQAIVKDVHLEPASEQEIADTVSVMGGEDWQMWFDALAAEDLIAEGCRTVAYTYIGTKLTWAIYREGTIGKAKEDLERVAKVIDDRLRSKNGAAYIAVMKAIVTQSSSAIPVVPLYISMLYKVMKEKGGHEGSIEQVHRLFASQLYAGNAPETDEASRIRLDDLEMRSEIQRDIEDNWAKVTNETLHQLTDFKGYQQEFLKLFGFGLAGVDYDADVDPAVGFEE